ncbi:hypothetical protein JK358_32530 [Nocardia sp. 2]|uniref:DUF6879 domain-containing protein n=1 Tax=Nocardia acididurans TaxID=2802282 RepID=A0ABS1MER0_9NOCA|nr:DUF6879 family protein [Nocardia acididurans]MBL1079141.1 hypothetical protein [Nocardia acididurans]
MLHLSGRDFTDLFRTCQRSAFHIEVQDSYSTPEESEPFHRFLTGQPDDYGWLREWLDIVRAQTKRGVAFTRLRVVAVPHADYTRWGLAVAPSNIEAGEDIRYLPRASAAQDVPRDDYWLFDESTVAFTLFDSNGRAAGAAVTTDPALVRRATSVREALWGSAVPHSEYIRATVAT